MNKIFDSAIRLVVNFKSILFVVKPVNELVELRCLQDRSFISFFMECLRELTILEWIE